MSGAVRSYRRGSPLSSSPVSSARFGFIRNTAKVAVFAFVIAAVYVVATTRDTHPVEEFVSDSNTYHVNVYDFLNRRATWASSPIWNALPENWIEEDIPHRLLDNHGFPEWMVRNWMGRRIHLTGSDGTTFSDVVLITRMTTVGTLLERVVRRTPRFRSDEAGGLHLRFIEDEEVFYAVRGRTLLLSASRSALVQVLTLAPGDRTTSPLPSYSVDRPLVQADWTPNTDEGVFRSFTQVEAVFRFDTDAWNVTVRGTLSENADTRWRSVVHPESGDRLYIPVDGAAVLSLNTGSSLRELWPNLSGVFSDSLFPPEQWHAWEKADPNTSYAPTLSGIVGDTGSRLALSWNGFDLNAQTPAPLMTAILSIDDDMVRNHIEQLSPEPPGEAFRAAYSRFDDEENRAYFYGHGGPARTTVLAPHDGFAMLTTGISAMDGIAESSSELGGTLEGDGNVYVSVKPGPATEFVVEAGGALAAYGMIADTTQEKFERNAARWREKAMAVDAVSMVGSYEDGVLDVTLQIQAAAH
jgi:hypothetical protein